jgi:hypothetical protein
VVTWHYCGEREHFPLLERGGDLPQSWIDEPVKLRRAGIPEEKWKITVDLLDRLTEWVEYEIIVADTG